MDGTTATTLAPSEDEMQNAVSYIQRMKDAVVEGSKLAQEFAALRVEVDGLKHELEHLRETNRWMDGQITELRGQREDALAKVYATQQELSQVKTERDGLFTECENQRRHIDSLVEKLMTLHADRDQVHIEGLKALEELDTAKAQLARIREAMGLGEYEAPPDYGQPQLPGIGQIAPAPDHYDEQPTVRSELERYGQ